MTSKAREVESQALTNDSAELAKILLFVSGVEFPGGGEHLKRAVDSILGSTWLAAHDRAVAARALRDAGNEAKDLKFSGQLGGKFARWLDRRADEIEGTIK